jgi:2-oxoglutarate ferredoxin oxidoreductase subunit delta
MSSLFRTEKIEPPSGKAGKWNVIVSEDMCKACSFCISICPVDVFAWRQKPNKIGWIPVWVSKEENCIGCMLCYQICPDFCIDVVPKGSTKSQTRESAEAPASLREAQNGR